MRNVLWCSVFTGDTLCVCLYLFDFYSWSPLFWSMCFLKGQCINMHPFLISPLLQDHCVLKVRDVYTIVVSLKTQCLGQNKNQIGLHISFLTGPVFFCWPLTFLFLIILNSTDLKFAIQSYFIFNNNNQNKSSLPTYPIFSQWNHKLTFFFCIYFLFWSDK